MSEASGARLQRQQLFAIAAIAVLAILASVSGINNGFALDDTHIIAENDRVHSLHHFWNFLAQTYWPPSEGAALYRPFSILGFAVQWAIGHGSPLPFHVTSIALYVLSCVLLYRLAILVVPFRAAVIGSALFAVHPVHTEAVANVVGQEELWVAIVVLACVTYYVRLRTNRLPNVRDVVLLSVGYLAACMFKENAIVLPAMFVAVELTLKGPVEWRARFKQLFPLFASLTATGVVFVALRAIVTGKLAGGGTNVLLLGQPYPTRFFTMLTVFMEWVRLLVWPANLSADYSSHRIDAHSSFDLSMLPTILIFSALVAIAWSVRKSRPAVTFALAWAGVTLLIPSNLVVLTGFVLAERSLFLPSAGLAIGVGLALLEAWRLAQDRGRAQQLVAASLFLVALTAGVVRSSTRNPAWRDNESLVHQTVVDVPTSYRAHWMMAEYLTDHGEWRDGLDEMLLTIALGRPNDPGLLSFGADRFRMANQCPRAMGMYRKALKIDPTIPELRFNASICLMQLGKLEEAKSLARQGLAQRPDDKHLQRVIVFADSLANLSKKNNSAG